MLDGLSLSDALGYASIGCWLGAQFPQVVENIKLQSCDGLALPFLANWLLGDISNLVGCILTHQLPFQRYLATYFVCVDCMLVAQYFYYYKPPKGQPAIMGHIRSATSPAAIRRMSIDRGASRYRTLSVVASNVAAAAALAAHQDEEGDHRRSNTHISSRRGRRGVYEASNSLVSRGTEEEEEYEENIPTAMIDSFRSEGRRDLPSKRVSWSIERHRGRAASVGRTVRSTTPSWQVFSTEVPVPTRSPDGLLDQNAPLLRDTNPLLNSDEYLTPVISTRGSRASRKGSTMIFLGVWTLFGLGTLAGNQRSTQSSGTTGVGQVLTASTEFDSRIPIALSGHSSRDVNSQDFTAKDFDIAGLDIDIFLQGDPSEDPHDDPSSEQVVGRIFAWLCTTLYLTSRLPQIWKNYTRKSVEGLSMYLFVFAFLGNCFYVASILTSPRRCLPPSESMKFIQESIPYLLGSGGTLMFDITIVGQSFCYKPRHRRHGTTIHRVSDEEAAGLLSGDAMSAHPPGDSAIMNRGRTSRAQSTA